MATHLWYKKKALIDHAAIPGTLARLLSLSGDSWGTGAGKAALPAQTRQGNKIFGIRRDFQITKIENSSEVAFILGFSLEMSLHP